MSQRTLFNFSPQMFDTLGNWWPENPDAGTNDGGDDGQQEEQGTWQNEPPPSAAPATLEPDPTTPVNAVTPVTPAHTPMISDTRHVYVGTDNRGDVYQLIDENGRVLEWAVNVNDASGNILPGTLRDLGNPSGMTTAQGSAYVPPVGAGTTTAAVISTSSRIASNPRHVYVGTDGRGDVWQLVDEGGNVIEWAVRINDSSSAVLEGTTRNLGAPSAMTTAQGGAYVPPPQSQTYNGPPPVISGSGIPGSVNINNNNATTTNPPPPPSGFGNPRQSNARHVYAGRTGGFDLWQIFDGTNVIQWKVRAGDESGNMIPGTAQNLGPPSAATKAQDDGTPQGGPVDTTLSPTKSFVDTLSSAQGGGGIGLTIAGIAATLIGTVFK